jgi:hypothetical protein
MAKQQGALMVDHSASPGITLADVLRLRALGHDVPFVPEGKKEEFETKTCKHCKGAVAILRGPLTPTRDEGYCRRCDHFICQGCALEMKLTGECNDANRRADRLFSDKFVLPKFTQPSAVGTPPPRF